jgi:hypothetical protein
MRNIVALGIGMLALMAAPVGAGVHVGVNIGVPPPPQIAITAPPPLVVVPGSPVTYAPEVPYNFFSYGGAYYVFNDGYWYSAPAVSGPWVYVRNVPRPVLAVPVRYYHAPPRHWHGPGHGHEHFEHDHHH